jgi:hypothetical protein
MVFPANPELNISDFLLVLCFVYLLEARIDISKSKIANRDTLYNFHALNKY